MNARLLLLLAALIPAGFLASCSYPHHHNRAALSGGLGPQYKYRATKYTQYAVSPYVPNVDFNSTTKDNYFNGRYLGNNKYRCAPLVQYGTQGKATIDYHPDSLHYHNGNRYYGGDYAHGTLYRHSHSGFRPHKHNTTPVRPE